MAVASLSREEALLAEIERLNQAFAEERAEKEALRAEIERIYRIVEDEMWNEDVQKIKREKVAPTEKDVFQHFRKLWPDLPKNEYGLAERPDREIAAKIGISLGRVQAAFRRGKKMDLFTMPDPEPKIVRDERSGKPLIDKRTGKPIYTSKSWIAPLPIFDDPDQWKVPEILVRKPSGHHQRKPPIPICPFPGCGLPATNEHAVLHCANEHEWIIDTDFEADVAEDQVDSPDDDELAAIWEAESADYQVDSPTYVIDYQVDVADLEPQIQQRKPALEELRGYAQGVCWRYGPIDLKTGKRKKPPLNPKTGGLASVSDPETWGTCDEALALKARSRAIDGIGFVFTESDPFVGIDLDGCIDENGIVSDQAAAIVAALDSYTEYSPSHTGLHIIAKGKLPAAVKTSSVEMYATGRYFTFTGEQLPGTPATIMERQAQITALYERIVPAPATIEPLDTCSLPCADIEALLHRGRNDKKFLRLWKGDTSQHGKDASRADMALVRKLAFYLGDDDSRIDAAFRQSGLMRPKWDEIHGYDEQRRPLTYGQMTIAKVLGPPTVHTKPSPSTEPADAQSDEAQLDALGERLNYPTLQLAPWSKVAAGRESWQNFLRFQPTKVAAMLVAALLLIGGAV